MRLDEKVCKYAMHKAMLQNSSVEDILCVGCTVFLVFGFAQSFVRKEF